MQKKKILYIEILRVLAVFGVIYCHNVFHVIDTEQLYLNSKIVYGIYNVLYVISYTAVPLFFMISGCLLMEKEESLEMILKKRVFRMVIVLVLFTFTFYLITIDDDFSKFSIGAYFARLFGEGVHSYWYLYAYIMLMLGLPFLRAIGKQIKENPELIQYLIVMKVIMSVVIPIIEAFSGVTAHASLAFPYVGDSIFYFLMGYYFGKLHATTGKECARWLLASFGAFLLEFILIYALPDQRESLYRIGIFAVTFAIYTGVKWLTEHIFIPNLMVKVVCWIGAVSFPMYLIENVVAGKIRTYMYPFLNGYMHGVVAFLIYLNMTVFIEAVIGTCMKKIPVMKHLL